jgi:hypothetical protein
MGYQYAREIPLTAISVSNKSPVIVPGFLYSKSSGRVGETSLSQLKNLLNRHITGGWVKLDYGLNFPTEITFAWIRRKPSGFSGRLHLMIKIITRIRRQQAIRSDAKGWTIGKPRHAPTNRNTGRFRNREDFAHVTEGNTLAVKL